MNERLDCVPVALYARVSSDRQDVELSIAAQLRASRDYAAKNGYIVAREYVDEAESGRSADRPEFGKMIDAATRPNAAFQVILVWKFSRFTRKREHAVVFKAMLKRKGVRVISITEHADDSPTGKLMEGIIESVDEFYSENLAQEVTRGMREAASRGFWVSSRVPYGYRKVMVQDGAKKRPKLEPVEREAGLLQRMFRMAESGRSVLDVVKTLNWDGIPSPMGKRWSKTAVHLMLRNETYTGVLVWGVAAKDKAEPIRVEEAFPAIVSRETFDRVARLLESRAPAKVNPRRLASSYLLSGLLRCEACSRALTGQESKGGQFAYYVCNSLLKRGQGECESPRLNARRFERLVIDQIRENILTESNMRELVRLVGEEMDGVAAEQGQRLQTIEEEQVQVKRWLDRLYWAIETTDIEPADVAPRIREHRDRLEKLDNAAEEAGAMLSERRVVLDDVETIASYARDMNGFLMASDLSESRSFIRSFVKEIGVSKGSATIRYTIPMPHDSRMPGRDMEEVALASPVLRSVNYGGPSWIRTRDLGLIRTAL